MTHRDWTRSALPAAVSLLLLTACGGGGTGAPGGVAVSGTVAGPSGVTQEVLRRAAVVRPETGGGPALNPNTTPLGAGITVNLIQIDGQGSQVGSPLATGTTGASGSFALTAPAGFIPGPSYVIQAMTPGTPLQGFATSATTNVDPYTQTAVALVTASLQAAGTSIAALTDGDITAVQQTVLGKSGNIALALGTTAAQMAAALGASVQNDVEAANIVNSLAAPGGFTGTVRDSSAKPVAGAEILVRRFGNQLTMAMTRTGSDGTYTAHVPAGDYIIAAINDTTASTAASAWWTVSGGVLGQNQAQKVTVASALVPANFTLGAGGRLAGTVTASDTGLPLAGIQVALNDFSSAQTQMFILTQPDGSFTFNVSPGSFYLSMRNSTLQPYGTANYNGSATGGGINSTQASRITVSAGASLSGSIALVPGHMVSGIVSDPVTGPVSGLVVRFQDYTAGGIGAESMRTGADGTYRIWLQPGYFNVWTRGQQANDINLDSTDAVQNFSAAVGQITGTLVDSLANPVSQAYVYVYNSANDKTLGFEVCDSNGNLTVYTASPTTNVRIGFLIDNGDAVGSTVYASTGSGVLEALSAGSVVAAPAPGSSTALGTITLPVGSVLAGTVTDAATQAPLANNLVQVRIGGVTGAYNMVTQRTRSDGSYSISLPAGATLDNVITYPYNENFSFSTLPPPTVDPGVYALVLGQLVGASGTTTVNFSY